MEHVEALLKTAMGEIERMLDSKTVVGDPIQIEGTTIIPLVSVGFGFGAGGGQGTGSLKTGEGGEGTGGGTGGGGGVKPVALIIIDKDGVRIEPIKGAATSVLERVAEVIGQTMKKEADESKD